MNTASFVRAIVLVQALALAAAISAQAAADDYAFKITDSDIHPGDGAIFAVSLTDLRTNTPVSGAVIFTTRLDMAPDGMAGMTSPVAVLSEDTPGIYSLQADLAMAGNWRLQIAAKVQGEAETVQGALIFGVQK